jgi:serine/threonine protein phosphatase PrpC
MSLAFRYAVAMQVPSLPAVLAGAFSRQGKGHAKNDDRYGLFDARDEIVRGAQRGAIYAVADGVGSTRDGAAAAEVVIQHLASFFSSSLHPSENLLIDVVEAADAEVRMAIGSASTVTGVWMAEKVVSIFNVGDSGVFLQREGSLHRMTPIQQRGGGLSAWVGMGPSIRHMTFLRRMPMQVGDRYLICSDGILDALTVDELSTLLAVHGDDLIDEVQQRLEDRGHTDDATMIQLRILEQDRGTPPQDATDLP